MPTSTITEQDALTMPRFDFIARWLVLVTKHKRNRGPLGQFVRRRGKVYEVMSGTTTPVVVYRTQDPDRLFDYARRTQLGSEIRRAEDFRTEAYMRRGASGGRTKSSQQIEQEIDAYLAEGRALRARMPRLSTANTEAELDERDQIMSEIRRIDAEVARRRPAPPTHPTGTGIWRVLDD